MNRFYTQHIHGASQKATISDAQDVKHAIKVLRLGIGDAVEICSGQGAEYIGTIQSIEDKAIELTLSAPLDITRELPCEITLFQGITKGQKWEYLVQKSVEAGIHHIVPVAMTRSVSKISDEKADKKADRYQKIVDEAAKQCKRSTLPTFHAPVSFKEALALQETFDLVLVAYEREVDQSLKTLESSVVAAKRIALWVGPEGGIDEKEIQALGPLAKTITLGKRILRTETAPVILLGQLSYILEM